ncbi:MAG: ATP-dependent helicase HrpB [Chloracidobacterium sp.]|nr:ATP-dependent helicase HrpB [Chloracidobacterium sp.]MDW8216509.1 ATP-dependent helicase HrpB [Acidobacteriota bacterium]
MEINVGRRTPLPIDEHLTTITETLRTAGRLIIQAAPGAGKTTRVPLTLLASGVAGGEVVVVVPRRLAARMAARYVAREMGERLGGVVGYTVRFDDRTSAATRLRFVTDGVLTRRLLGDPTLQGVGVVVIDEFHERRLTTDIALARVRDLQRRARPDLKLVVMSATLDAERLSAFLDAAPVVTVPGRTFPVRVRYAASDTTAPLASRVAAAVEQYAAAGPNGDILVFLPGAADIRACLRACAPAAARYNLALHALHASLPADEQDAAVRPGDRRKVVFATNVAESSITIDNITVVIDSGLVRRVEYSPWTGLPQTAVGRIAQSAAIQRAGRAGRTCPGECLRLYTEADFNLRPAFETPEIHRADLAETVLELRAAGYADVRAFPWFEPPAPEALAAAETLLRRLGAVDARGVTPLGRAMLDLPTSPRMARLIVEGRRRGVLREACRVAALLDEREVRAAPLQQSDYGHSDVLALLETFESAADATTVGRIQRVEQQLFGIARRLTGDIRAADEDDRDAALGKALLAAFPDRVGRLRRRTQGTWEVVLGSGGRAELAPTSVVATEGLVVALDAETQPDGTTLVRLAVRIEPDWLLELFLDDIEETDTHELRADGRVVRLRRLLYDGVVMEERALPTVDSEAAARVLVARLRADGWRAYADVEAVEQLRARLAFAAKYAPEVELPTCDDAAVWAAVERLCVGCATLDEVRRAARTSDVTAALLATLTPPQRAALERLAPETLQLGRRRVRIMYPPDGSPPYIAAPIQDFFGLKTTPRIADGRVPLTLHLLAPNQRPVQVTTDLESFWKRTYRELRPQLARRYPKHAFPEQV